MIRTIKSLVVTSPDEIRCELETLTTGALIKTCANLDRSGDSAEPDTALASALRSMAAAYELAHKHVRDLTRTLTDLTTAAAPGLLEVFGVGPDTAAKLLITAGDGRIRSEAALAKMAGVCPIPTGSGKTNGRHRLNRGGTAPSTPRSTESSLSASSTAQPPVPTSNDAPLKASPRKKSSDA